MRKRNNISIEYLRQCLREEDGKLYWLVRPRDHFPTERSWKTWNSAWSGREAGCICYPQGKDEPPRWRIRINYINFYRYRLIWALKYGEWPDELDHKNNDPMIDSSEETRISTHSQNMGNQRVRSNNKSGYKGVSWITKRQKYQAMIKVNYKGKFLGYYDTAEEAAKAYAEGSKKYFGEFSRIY